MKRKLLTAFLGLSLSCYAQSPYVESFEGDVFPPDGWNVYDNGIGTDFDWKHGDQILFGTPVYEGYHSAYVNLFAPESGTAQDWLVTPVVNIASGMSLQFKSSYLDFGPEGGTCSVRVCPADADPSVLSNYTIVQVVDPLGEIFTDVQVYFPETMEGQDFYIAFVTEINSGEDGNTWIIDNVALVGACPQPYNLAVATTGDSAELSWTAWGETAQWEIEVLPLDAAPTGEGVIVDENTYTVTDLDMGEYRFYVRSICSEALQSSWAGPFYFDILNGFNGVVNYDSEGDSVCDTPLPGAEVIITIGDEQYSVYTDEQGHFNFYNIAAETATVTVNVNAVGFNNVPALVEEFDFAEEDLTLNVCLEQPEAVTDLSITLIPVNQARPGFVANYQLLVKNNGSVAISTATATVQFDDVKLEFDSSPNSYTLNDDIVSFDLMNLAPYSTQYIPVSFSVMPPPENIGGEEISFDSNVTVPENENTPADNSAVLYQTIVNSYDPNDITVHEGEYISMEQAQGYLHYTIRFQNTGTADAVNIRLENILDDNFDWSTFEPLASSHAYTVIRQENELEFKFDNIHLPDSTTDEPGSHGFVTYRVKPLSEVEDGDEFNSIADIYFDFNPAIITNTAHTEIALVGVEQFNTVKFILYPNPVTERLYITSQSGENIIYAEVYDINGKLCFKQDSLQGSIDVQSLNSGFYFIKLTTETTTLNYKFIKK
ncbi:T9SS type A sorting domain-containing protein [Flavobacterium alkalisoli]|uniref:T9SS type A sorting domain-containing protein n=1 Tax=Flavobacterium alkalisoli TaxID=2602769 RepID=A0A5B9FT15_9FLAO|nr:choice-of-anchor J domain-containing protein [Flavobacterium alkalisoli]QEE48848.1 T9SS type A sorting domain-containing protein [Flavobacterium alkalisoli]